MNYFTIDGISSRKFGVGLSGSGTFDAPARNTESQSIPGRNGDLHIDGGSFANVTVTYPCFISTGFMEKYDDFKAWLCHFVGYQRLEDTYYPDRFRMVSFENGIAPSLGTLNDSGEFEIAFNCKPQRFFKSGEHAIEIASDTSVYNEYYYDALPLIRAYGSGTLVIGSDSIEITNSEYEYIDIDTEISDASYGTANCNSMIKLSGSDFPSLPAKAKTGIQLEGLTKIELTPRWWTV